MYKDEILEEIHKYREDYAKSFNYDLQAIFEDIRKKQAASGRKMISVPLKQSRQQAEKLRQ
jgi:hypothetical protein